MREKVLFWSGWVGWRVVQEGWKKEGLVFFWKANPTSGQIVIGVANNVTNTVLVGVGLGAEAQGLGLQHLVMEIGVEGGAEGGAEGGVK